MTFSISAHVRFGVGDCLREPDREKRRLDAILGRLWRVSETEVTAAYDAAIFGSLDEMPAPCSEGGQGYGLLAEKLRAARRPLLSRDRQGLSLTSMSLNVGLDRETLASLLEKHEYITNTPYGRTQNRRLCSDSSFYAGIGHNVDPGSKRSLRLDGMARAAPFPVFYEEHVASILWTLNWSGIVEDVSEHGGGKRGRIEYAVGVYGYLPNAALAGLCACSKRGIEQARLRQTARRPEPVAARGCSL